MYLLKDDYGSCNSNYVYLDKMQNLVATMLPNSSTTNVDFFLFTQSGKIQLLKDDIQGINDNLPVKVIVHGWGENIYKDNYQRLIKAYLRKGNCNVIAVDYYKPAIYRLPEMVKIAKTTGPIIGDFIVQLHKTTGVSLNDIHIVCHSLGGHVSGFAGKTIFKLTGQKVSRITALDPAGLFFEQNHANDKSNRLSIDDALVVDVIHTDGGVIGYNAPLGTVDFYVNGGSAFQPTCGVTDLSKFLMSLDIGDLLCSHVISIEYFIESINFPKSVLASNCSSYNNFQLGLCRNKEKAIFGENYQLGSPGKYYFKTKSRAPFLE